MTNFQIGVYIFFGLAIIAGVLVFSGLVPGLNLGGGSSSIGGQVVVWGTLPSSSMATLVENFNRDYKPLEIIYIEKNPSSFDRELTESLASGVGPDLIMLPDNLIYRHADKITPVPYTTVSEGSFKTSFVQEGELYLLGSGILALPFTLDPMVMYWNRDLFNTAGIAQPPKTWEEVMATVPKLTLKDSSQNITQSAVSLGEYRNVNYAKDIIALLSIQAGNPIVTRTQTGFRSVFGESQGLSLNASEEAVRYYANFNNPSSPLYSWNKSLPNSRNAFLSGQLAMYFGYASELFGLRSQNPHLNFDVAKMPQVKGTQAVSTLGKMNGLALMKVSKNPAGAARALLLLTSQDFAQKLTEQTLLPPPRRDLLSVRPKDAYMSVFFDSALASKSWIDPSPEDTDGIFKELIDNVSSGRVDIASAVNNTNGELNRMFGAQN